MKINGHPDMFPFFGDSGGGTTQSTTTRGVGGDSGSFTSQLCSTGTTVGRSLLSIFQLLISCVTCGSCCDDLE